MAGATTSPADRFAAARHRARAGAVGRFESLYPFELDEFQLQACRAVEAGDGVLVAAPTGAGKTIVGEFAIHLALEQRRKCFYTTPIKALSNQKFTDLVDRYGPETIGLLTGDNSINGDAPVVVMTTEVLRNMLYTASTAITDLGFVVMDEVHYLADRFRGAVWEEVIIHLPESVQLVSLSATVSNAEEFGAWLTAVRGTTQVVVEEQRPVPLWQHVMVGRRLYDLFGAPPRSSAREAQPANPRPTINPMLAQLLREERRQSADAQRRRRDGRYPNRRTGRAYTPSRVEVVERLDAEGLLPAITFIFSRAGCDAAVEQCLRSGLRLVTVEERDEIRAVARAGTSRIPSGDLTVLGYDRWLEGLERGVAAHHAGMLPVFKEVVEDLFARGLIRAVFATETLALGINMPARSVVLERLTKWNGDTHADITPGEYTQLTGRAGRRGIDVEGHAVVLWQPDLDITAVGGLASTRTYPLRSSFRPSYNMAVNLLRQYGRATARELLEQSFAQFQADRAVVGLVRQVRKNEEALAGYREAMQCHLGDIEEYAAIRRTLDRREADIARATGLARRAAAVETLERLQRGDVVYLPSGRRAGVAIVLDAGIPGGRDGPRPLVLTSDRQVKRLGTGDVPGPLETIGHLRLPRNFNARSPQARRDLASTLRNKGFDARQRLRRTDSGGGDDAEISRLRGQLRAHPCHGCTDREDHLRWADRYAQLGRETVTLSRRADSRTHTVARRFDRICDVLRELGYVGADDAVTDDGARLGRIYTELDLLASECVRSGDLADLAPAELAACVSVLVYESRRADDAPPPRLPAGQIEDVLARVLRRWGQLDAVERAHGLDPEREPDLGFVWPVYLWASGSDLEDVVGDGDLTPGDFVRWVRQVVDLLGQLGDAAPDETLRRTARQAVAAVQRGVVAYSSVG
jgi:ATP-dependent RNA helicase HelY